MRHWIGRSIGMGLALAALGWLVASGSRPAPPIPDGRQEVVFWHFWGGQDRDVVDEVVARFNASQGEYFVRAVAMPGNNLQAKLFLSVAGGDPPDLINQDDPVIPDWGARGVIQPIETVAPAEEVAAVSEWMFDSARRLSTWEGRMYGICNGLDIRALYFNRTLLAEHGLAAPESTTDLDRIAETIAPPGTESIARHGYLPDTRRLWAWGFVFGGKFYDTDRQEVTLDSPEIVSALEWMAAYRDRYGADRIAAFRKGDQSLPGKPFPLLPVTDDSMAGRYAVVMDGQWRVRDLEAFRQRRMALGLPCPEFGVCPLPPPPSGGRERSGWVNGNFFVIPRGARQATGAWEFAKFWIGYTNAREAAKTCAQGGWIPVSKAVIETPEFQQYLARQPLFSRFVDLAGSPHQYPIPQVVGAAMFKRTVESAGYEALLGPPASPRAILQSADRRVQQQLDRVRPAGGVR